MSRDAAVSEQADSGWQRLLEFLGEADAEGEVYEGVRARLVGFFRWRGAVDPEGYADRVFDRVASKLAAGEAITARNPAAYLLAVARYIHLEGKKEEARLRVAAEASPSAEPVDEAPYEALEACLAELHPSQRALVLRYHAGSGRGRIDGRQAIADELGISLTGLRMRVFRIRQRLERCLRRCGASETDPADGA